MIPELAHFLDSIFPENFGFDMVCMYLPYKIGTTVVLVLVDRLATEFVFVCASALTLLFHQKGFN